MGEEWGNSTAGCKKICLPAESDDRLSEGAPEVCFLLTFGSADVNLSLENQVKIWLSIFAQSEDSPSGRLLGEVAELA